MLIRNDELIGDGNSAGKSAADGDRPSLHGRLLGEALAATKAATSRVDQLVPGLVDQAMRFEREVPAATANAIAQQFGKEESQ